MITIQLLGQNAGYLDTLEESVLALNISLADIKDITKRTGSFSKTIKLPGTKNNNLLLNDYFEVNVLDGTFSINKVQRCLILDNNIPIFNNTVLQLLSVNKEQSTNMEDDLVEYEVSIKDTTADFFTIINNRYLDQLDFSEFGHTYSSSVIVDSFNHTWVDGYKYILNFGDDNFYPIGELKPAIYAKQYWNRIHADAGFSYVWNEEFANFVRFDKLLIPYNNGENKNEEIEIDKVRVIAENMNPQGLTLSGLPSPVVIGPGSYYRWLSQTTTASTPVEIQDPINAFNPITSIYTTPFYVTQPNFFEWIVEFDWVIKLNNKTLLTNTVFNSTQPGYGEFNVVGGVLNSRTGVIDSVVFTNTPTPSIRGNSYGPGITSIFSGSAKKTINTSNHQLGDLLNLRLGVNHVRQIGFLAFTRPTDVILEVTNLRLTIEPSVSQIFNTPVTLSNYIPTQLKQSDFIKSIMMMYNLFVEVDPIDPNKLIYTSRDEFYDTGALVDWTYKLARDKEQNLKFLPELSAKSFIFSYKDDDDPANKTYLENIHETYGQHQVIFSNNYVKGIERKEIIFSPTPCQRTDWGAVLPLLPSAEQKFNIRILLDNGLRTSQSYYIVDYIDPNVSFPFNFTFGSYQNINYYPYVSHLDQIENPSFDLNFGVCDFYFYDIKNITNNNLFNLYWRRTAGQINNGKLLTAYFYLKSSDISNLRLNAKIRIDNSYWNINKIVDFDANKQQLTKVELISIDDEVLLPAFGADSDFFTPNQQLPPPFNPTFISTNDTISKAVTQKFNDLNHLNRTTNNSNNGVISLGSFNSIDGGVKGVLIGDFIHATESGLYIGQNTFIGGNLGNVGGLPSTLAVDNTTGGNSIIVSSGDVIEGEPGSGLFLYSDSDVSIVFNDNISNYSNIQAGNAGNSEFLVETSTVGVFKTFLSGGSGFTEIVHQDDTGVVYGNSVRLNNNTSAGVVIESNDLTTGNFSRHTTTSDFIETETNTSTDIFRILNGSTSLQLSVFDVGTSLYNNNIFLYNNTSNLGILIEAIDQVNIDSSKITNTSANITIQQNNTSNNRLEQIELSAIGVEIRTEDQSATIYQNKIMVSDGTSNGVFIQSEDFVTTDIGSIQVTPTQIVITNPTLLVLNSPLINIPNLPPYADDAAAGAGGLNTGDLYQTDGTGVLTTAGIVMIKQ